MERYLRDSLKPLSQCTAAGDTGIIVLLSEQQFKKLFALAE